MAKKDKTHSEQEVPLADQIEAADEAQLSVLASSINEQFEAAEEAQDEDKQAELVALMASISERKQALVAAAAAETEAEAEDKPKKDKKKSKAKDEAKAEPEVDDNAKVEVTDEAPADEDKTEDKAGDEVVVESETGSDEASAEIVAESGTNDNKEETPMAASVNNKGSEPEVEIQPDADRLPVIASATTLVAAGADIPGFSAGSNFNNEREVNEAFLKKLNAVRRSQSGSGEQHIVATVTASIPDDRFLSESDALTNANKIEEVISTEAIVAAGGCCAPLEAKYDIFGLGVTSRPVRDSLPAFGTTRAGIRFVRPPVLGALSGAVSFWNCETDANASNNPFQITNVALTSNVATVTTATDHGLNIGDTVIVDASDNVFDGTYVVTAVPADDEFSYSRTNANVASAAATGTVNLTKACLTVTCAAEVEASVTAIPLCLKFGNLSSRAYPELVARNNQLALIEHARASERFLLSLIDAASTQTTHAQVFGSSRDFLIGIGRAAALYRNRHRLDENHPLRLIAPVWVKDAIRDDLAAQLPGDSTLNISDAEISSMISGRGVNVTWHLDGTSTAQSAGDLNCYPTSFEVYLFAEGSFLFLDGGTLDLGIIRDSGLVGTNDYLAFVETFEGIAFVGVESVAITFTTAIEGATMGTLNPATTDYCALANA